MGSYKQNVEKRGKRPWVTFYSSNFKHMLKYLAVGRLGNTCSVDILRYVARISRNFTDLFCYFFKLPWKYSIGWICFMIGSPCTVGKGTGNVTHAPLNFELRFCSCGFFFRLSFSFYCVPHSKWRTSQLSYFWISVAMQHPQKRTSQKWSKPAVVNLKRMSSPWSHVFSPNKPTIRPQF